MTAERKPRTATLRTLAGVGVFALSLGMALSFLFGSAGGQPRLIPDKWLNQDGSFYYLTLRTLVDHGSFAQDATQPRSWYEQDLQWNRTLNADWSDVCVGREGHWYPKHSVLMPLFTVPLFYAFDAWGALILNILCLALIPVIGYRIALKFAPWGAALAAAAVLATSAFLSNQAYGYSNDLFYAVFVLLAFDAAFDEQPVASGVWFSLSVFAKATNAIVLPGLALAFLLRKDTRGLIRFAVGATPVTLVFAALNTWMYGAPWHTGYNHILVRVNGQQGFHDHAQDFDWARWLFHVRERLVAPQGSNTFNMWDRYKLGFLAAPGALVALWRAPKRAVPLLLGAFLPLLLLAPFQYFRVEFLNPSVGLCVALTACLLWPHVKAPAPEPKPPPRVRWARLGPAVAAVILLVASGVRAATTVHGDYFERHLNDAKVFAGPIPCDYFNWQVQRWECANFDRGNDDVMTGRSLRGLPRFGGKPEPLLSLAPPLLRAPRTITYSNVPLTQKLQVRYGLRDGTVARGQVVFNVHLPNQSPIAMPLGPPGELETAELDTSAFAGQTVDVTFEVNGSAPGGPPVFFDGRPL